MNSLVCLASAVSELFRPTEARAPKQRLRAPAQPNASHTSATTTSPSRRRGSGEARIRSHVSRAQLVSLRNQDALRDLPFPLVAIDRLEPRPQQRAQPRQRVQQLQRRASVAKQCQEAAKERRFHREARNESCTQIRLQGEQKSPLNDLNKTSLKDDLPRKRYRTEVEKLRVQNDFFVPDNEMEGNDDESQRKRRRVEEQQPRSKRRKSKSEETTRMLITRKDSSVTDEVSKKNEAGFGAKSEKSPSLKVKITRSPVGHLETFVLNETTNSDSVGRRDKKETALSQPNSNYPKKQKVKEAGPREDSKFKLKFLRDKRGRIVKVASTLSESSKETCSKSSPQSAEFRNDLGKSLREQHSSRFEQNGVRVKERKRVSKSGSKGHTAEAHEEDCDFRSAWPSKKSRVQSKKIIKEKASRENREESESPFLQTNCPYFVWLNEVEFKRERDVMTQILRHNVEVPQWRINPILPCKKYEEEVEEDLEITDDESYLRVHSKLEYGEKRRKRWDIQRIRELHRLQRLRERYDKSTKTDSSTRSNSLYPDPNLITHIQVADVLPVSVFACQLPKMATAEFSLSNHH